jgi:hypothetical protein
MNRRRGPLLELERHVMRCRRREEPALLMLAHIPCASRSTGHRLACCYRVTDSVLVARVGRHHELVALFDDDGLDRSALEQRMRAAAGVEPTVSWARFPDDGVTLDALVAAARMQLRALNADAITRAVLATPAAVDGK